MKIKQMSLKKGASDKLDIAWTLSGREQSSYELFLICNGAVAEAVKASSEHTRCRLNTVIEPMKSYAILLTVTSGGQMASVCAGIYPIKEKDFCQTIIY